MFKLIILGLLAITVGDRQSISAGKGTSIGAGIEDTKVNKIEKISDDFVSTVNFSEDALNGYSGIVLKVVSVNGNKLKFVDDAPSGYSYLTAPNTVRIRDFNKIVEVKTSKGLEKDFQKLSLDYLKTIVPCYVGIVGKIKYTPQGRVINGVKEIYLLEKAVNQRSR